MGKPMKLKKSDIEKYENVEQVIYSLLEDEDDWISAMATVVSELHNNFSHFNWTGFYRVVSPGLLKIGHIKEHMVVSQSHLPMVCVEVRL